MSPLLALLASRGLAADAVNPFEEPDESELFRFEEQLVTVASRYAQTVRKAPSIVTLITADEIRERGYRNVSEALRTLPGIYVWRSKEGRDLAAIRGVVSADDNKLLVLVDGVPWYEGVYTHGFIDDYLPISNIQQIEVIKGPGSAIYGTNAFTGVINIVTWRASDLEGARVRVMAGSTTRGDVTVSAGGRSRVGRLDTTATAYARLFGQTGQGIDVQPDLAIDAPGTDPRKGIAAGVELGVEGLRLQLHHVDYAHTYLVNGREDPFQALGRSLDTFDLQYHDTFVDARYTLSTTAVDVTPYAFYQRHDNPGAYFFGGDITVDPDTLEASQFFMTVDAEKTTERSGAGVDVQARPALDHVIVGGLGIEGVRVVRLFDYGIPLDGEPSVLNGFTVVDDCGQPTGLYTNDEACAKPRLRNLFGYVQYTWTAAPSVELTGGARVDKRIPTNEGEQGDDGAFVLAISPRAGVLLVPSDDVAVKLLYGRAFRAPNVRELLVRSEPDEVTGQYEFASGNLALIPETIHTTEGELTAAVAEGVELRADASWSLLVNEIDKIQPGLYCNLPGDLSILGGEVGAKVKAGPATLQGDYALTLATYGDQTELDRSICDLDWTDPYAGRRQYEYPPHMGKGSVRLALSPKLSMTAFGEVYSNRPRREWSPSAKNPDGEAFGLLHLAGRATGLGPKGNAEIGFAVRNVLDTAWNTGVYRDDADADDIPGGIAGEGRSVVVSVELAL
ncbi:MAG: TonB-dependent receptor [Myxococcales bacterium]|nr:TonB-dependent receptor [Myxococcales bacterium]